MIRRIAREMVLQSLFQMDFIDAAEESQTVLTGTQENSESVPQGSEQDPVKQPALEDALQVALEVQADEGDAEEAQRPFLTRNPCFKVRSLIWHRSMR